MVQKGLGRVSSFLQKSYTLPQSSSEMQGAWSEKGADKEMPQAVIPNGAHNRPQGGRAQSYTKFNMDLNAVYEAELDPTMVWKPPAIPTEGLWAHIFARLWLPAPSGT